MLISHPNGNLMIRSGSQCVTVPDVNTPVQARHQLQITRTNRGVYTAGPFIYILATSGMTDAVHQKLLEVLARDGVITNRNAQLTPLTGGVSSEIYRVDDGRRKFVVKRALARLNVQQDWFADVSRNRHEVDYLNYVRQFLPGAVPRVLAAGDGYFVMEFLGGEYRNWKMLLLERDVRIEHARQAGQILGTVHARSAGEPRAEREFNTLPLFRELRIDPYLRAAARRNPGMAAHLEAEAKRLEAWKECLVHGDFSPKNMLVAGDRMVVLDCEVACYGDAAFDLAFLINHLFLKALYHHPAGGRFQAMTDAFWQAYRSARPQSETIAAKLELRVGWLLPMLMLARVDGKSPVEYLGHDYQREVIRRFAHDQLGRGPQRLQIVRDAWLHALDELHP